MLSNLSETLHSERKFKKKSISQNLKSLTQKTKIWRNNTLSRRFGKYSSANWFMRLILLRHVVPGSAGVAMTWHSKILLDQLTLSQPGEADYVH